MNVDDLIKELKKSGIDDEFVLEALKQTPRELFIDESLAEYAYENRALPIQEEQTISQPYIVALMTQALQLTGIEKVLEIGTGSGYQTAILSKLAHSVISMERIPELIRTAQENLEPMKLDNVQFITGDGSLGYPPEAPYDGIIVTAATPSVPQALKEQLKEQGRLVIPVGTRYQQELELWTKNGTNFEVKNLCPCRFVPLIGQQGWEG